MDSGDIRSEIEALVIAHEASRKGKTCQGYEQKLCRFVDFLESNELPTHIEAIEPEHIGRFLALLRERGLSEHTVHGYQTAIRRLYNYRNRRLAALGRPCGRNPALAIPPVRCPDLNPDYLTEDEFDRLLQATKDPGHRAILATFGCTGLRSGELANLRLEDARIREGYLLVRYAGYRSPGPNKPGCERIVPLWRSYQAFLADYILHARPSLVPPDCPWIFARPGGQPMTVDANHNLVQRCLKAAGIIKRRQGPHLLRRTFAVILALHGYGLAEIALYLGHAQSTSTAVLLKNYIPEEIQARIVRCPSQRDEDPFIGISALRVR